MSKDTEYIVKSAHQQRKDQIMHNRMILAKCAPTILGLLAFFPFVACGGEETCIDIYASSSVQTCGKCGVVCEAEEMCYLGECVAACPAKAEPCGQTCCDPDLACSNDACVPRCDAGTSCGNGMVCNTNNECLDGCFISGTFYAPHARNPTNACLICDVSKPAIWTAEPQTPCETGGKLDPAEGYGMIASIHFSTGFLLDSARQMDASYMGEHDAAGVQQTPAFIGTYQTNRIAIPPAGSGGSVVSGFKVQDDEGGLIMIDQMSYQNAWGNWTSPVVRLYLDENVGVGSASIGHANGDSAQLMVYDIVGGTGLCLAAVGIGGTIDITKAFNLRHVDGGELEFSGSSVLLYHPIATPYNPGDISSDLGSTPICQPR